MGETLSAVWEQVTALLQVGVSVIPVRDREAGGYPPKTPYALWKQYQERRVTPQDLWEQMEKHNTAAIAMICGKVSGNLEAIDIDVKNWPGIDARYFEAIRDLYPVLWESLRIHSTPSGGYHILYRILDRPGPGNQKLATASHSTQAGIETRGEGGYIVAPPSLGYQVHRDNPIPVITWEERESLINLAKSFNEKIKVVPPPKIEKKKTDYYDEDPFADYNHSDAAESLLTDRGWTQVQAHHSHYLYYTRPGKNNGISASFHLERRLFYVFTSSTRLEPDRGYAPATLLSELQFNGDHKATYAWLVAQGYGKIKTHVEQRLVRTKLLSGDDLPANISPQAKELFTKEKDRLCTAYPHGTYWVQDDQDDVVKINRERFYTVAAALGFRCYNGAVVQLATYIIRRVTERQFYDAMKSYCVEEEADFLEAIRNAFESFIQRAGAFSMTRIQLLEEDRILKSSREVAYIGYQNGLLRLTASCHEFLTYENLTASHPGALIWEEQILPRDYQPLRADQDVTGSLYYQFLDKAIGISDYLWQIIGYLAHDFKDETLGYFILLVEQCEDPRDGGGTGKNLFCNLISHITTVKDLNGSQVQLNEKLLQSWRYERVLVISDVPKHFNYGFFKNISTGTATLKLLFKNEETVGPEQLPKLIFSTNYSYENVDGGIKRRIRPLEFTPWFTKQGGVKKFFGKHFPRDWSGDDWTAYDCLLHTALQAYLAKGEIDEQALSAGGWLKQFDQTYHFATRGFIQENWDRWLRLKFVSADDFKTAYDLYCNTNGIHLRYRLTSFRLHQALADWSRQQHIFFEPDVVDRINNILIRGKKFRPLEPAPF